MDAEGRSGGLVFFWKEEINLRRKNFSKNHIDFEVADESGNEIWRLTDIYGEPESHLKRDFWELLRRLGRQSDQP